MKKCEKDMPMQLDENTRNGIIGLGNKLKHERWTIDWKIVHGALLKDKVENYWAAILTNLISKLSLEEQSN